MHHQMRRCCVVDIMSLHRLFFPSHRLERGDNSLLKNLSSARKKYVYLCLYIESALKYLPTRTHALTHTRSHAHTYTHATHITHTHVPTHLHTLPCLLCKLLYFFSAPVTHAYAFCATCKRKLIHFVL